MFAAIDIDEGEEILTDYCEEHPDYSHHMPQSTRNSFLSSKYHIQEPI